MENASGADKIRAFPAEGDRDEVLPVLLATAEDRPVDPVIWGDEERMKRELMAWAKAVASMALDVVSSPAPPSASVRRHGTKCVA
ncbi:hypothetical protein BRADI_1g45535v3 [Brachypodium distachyon]|uniref:Uncharacterized protein n=1 Tax=Brachypodium distachyon TaxID=15368 RepID=A0A0Q3L6Z5_BRADI|nr:hypothetical protein BRADI_1g45535v3 [Brachypodium distachyon]